MLADLRNVLIKSFYFIYDTSNIMNQKQTFYIFVPFPPAHVIKLSMVAIQYTKWLPPNSIYQRALNLAETSQTHTDSYSSLRKWEFNAI